MAKTQKFIADLGSEEIKLTREQCNALVAVVEAIIDAAGEATFGDFATAMAAIDLSALRLLVAKPETRHYPLVPAV